MAFSSVLVVQKCPLVFFLFSSSEWNIFRLEKRLFSSSFLPFSSRTGIYQVAANYFNYFSWLKDNFWAAPPPLRTYVCRISWTGSTTSAATTKKATAKTKKQVTKKQKQNEWKLMFIVYESSLPVTKCLLCHCLISITK